MTNIINITTAKGGQGATTVASTLACVSARLGAKTLLVDAQRVPNVRACIALPNDDVEPISTLGDNLSVITVDNYLPDMADDYDLIIVDGLAHDLTGTNVLVTRNCYMALRNAVESGVKPDHIIVICEGERALTADDCVMVLRTSKIVGKTTVDWNADLARAVDAGLLNDRCLNGKVAPWAKDTLSVLAPTVHNDKVEL